MPDLPLEAVGVASALLHDWPVVLLLTRPPHHHRLACTGLVVNVWQLLVERVFHCCKSRVAGCWLLRLQSRSNS